MSKYNKILLINPPESTQGDFSSPPLGLLYLAGTLLQNGFQVELIDGYIDSWQTIKQKVIDYQPDLVGIPCLTPQRQKALAVAKMVKEVNSNILVVMGGVHPTIMYRQMLKHYPFIDICIIGEGEQTNIEIAQGLDWSKIDGMAFRKDGQIVFNQPRKYIDNLDEIPFPAWQLIDFKRYPGRGEGIYNGIDLNNQPRVNVIFSRGCVGKCSFCSTWWIWRCWRHRSPQNMVAELEWLNRDFGIKHFCFADDTMTVDRQVVIELCEEIIKRNLQIAFHITTRTDCIDEEMLNKLKEAGCYQIAFGIETGSEELLAGMNKNNEVANSKKAIDLARKVGIRTTALIIIGGAGETEMTINQTMDYLDEIKPDETGAVGGLWVLPGTKIYNDCKKVGFINDDFWLSNKPYKLYTLEHSRLMLSVYYSAFRGKRKLSANKLKNIARELPFILKNYAGRFKRIIKPN